jgi:hypothetical protein
MIHSNDIARDSELDLVRECARHIVDAFGFHNAEFRVITRRAPVRFETRDWKGSQRDAVKWIKLYDRFVNQTIAELRLQFGEAGAGSGAVGGDQECVRGADRAWCIYIVPMAFGCFGLSSLRRLIAATVSLQARSLQNRAEFRAAGGGHALMG